MFLSIVAPVYNSFSTLSTLVEQLLKTVTAISPDYEIILVDDGSSDASWQTIEELAAKYPSVKGIKLSRNFGQHHAIIAGLNHTHGEWVVVMDCDLQDDPAEIQALYKKTADVFPIVTASRTDRKDTFCKRWTSRFFWKTLGYLTGTSLNYKVANFGIYHRDVIDAICRLNESVPFFPTMVLWTGFKSTTIDVSHGQRYSGETAYSYYKMVKLAIDIILANSDKPIRIVIRIGLFISFISFVIGMLYFILHLTRQIVVPGFTSIIISIWFLGGLTILILGILGLYLGKTFEGVKGRPNYLIEKKTR